MAKFTNPAPGARGVLMKSGDYKLVEADETIELDDKDVKTPHPDLTTDFKGSPDQRPGLTGKSKDQLLQIATDEGATEAKDGDGNVVALADATNPQLVDAITAKRSA